VDLYYYQFDQICFDVNKKVVKKYSVLDENDFKEKTHYFHGRYENTYIDESKIPELTIIIESAKKYAAQILKTKAEDLHYGFWLNEMQPGHVTTAHSHDDDDELLSCVYYIKVPENSGNLIISENNNKTVIKPEEGNFIFFSPATVHEVSRNKSQQARLSMAFNFGLKQT